MVELLSVAFDLGLAMAAVLLRGFFVGLVVLSLLLLLSVVVPYGEMTLTLDAVVVIVVVVGAMEAPGAGGKGGVTGTAACEILGDVVVVVYLTRWNCSAMSGECSEDGGGYWDAILPPCCIRV